MTTATLTKQEKKELKQDGEDTRLGKMYLPNTDIHETKDALHIVMDLPGVRKEDLSISLEKSMLEVLGKIDESVYQGVKPLYSEYNVGHFSRRFKLSPIFDGDRIEASLEDGVLKLVVPKRPDVAPRVIPIH